MRHALGKAGERTPLALALAAAGARVGVTPYNWRMLKSTRRPQLHYRGRGRVPRPPLECRSPRQVTEADEALCERLITAYHAALCGRAGEDQAAGMWSWIYATRQRPLAEILDRRDAPALATELASMFRKTFMLGMAPGSLISHSESRLGARIWRVKSLDGLVSLAEALGAVPVEDPEQGSATRAFEGGLPDLIERVERRLGFSIDFPDVGAPYGLSVHERLVPIDSPEQIYSAVRLDQALRGHLQARAAEAPSIVEIGGGYGAACYWFLRGRSTTPRYVIVDLPIANVLQGYFLSRTLGEPAVSLFGEQPAQVVLAPNSALSEVATPYDVLVNKDSMPEMPEAAVREYLRWARATCDGIFFSCNQESTATFLGQRQGLVAEAVEQTGGFSRLRRDESWVRRGYVEEIYAADSCCASVRLRRGRLGHREGRAPFAEPPPPESPASGPASGVPYP